MTEVEHIKQLIASFILYRDEMSEDDKNALQYWINKDPKNAELFKKMIDNDNLSDYINNRNNIDLETSFNYISKSLSDDTASKHVKFYKRVWFYAASFLLLMGVGVTLFFMPAKNDVIISNSVADFEPGGVKAQLMFSDGRLFNLDEKSCNTTINEDGAFIHSDSIGIKYETDKQTTQEKAHHSLIVPKGGEYILTLEDGTVVHLNSQSTLEFPVHFADDMREVWLEGECYFDVKHSTEKPFFVHTQGMDIRVTGTEFNVMSYYSEDVVQTTLVNGHVDVEIDGTKYELNPSEQVELNRKSGKAKIKAVDVDDYISWINGWFVFKHERLESIMDKLGRWYDFDVFYQNAEVKDMIFGGKLDRTGSVEPILNIIKATLTLDYNINGKTIVFFKK